MASTVMRVAEVHALAYSRQWRGSVFSSFLSPILFLGAMGIGLGSLVDDGAGGAPLGGIDYLDFLAPGLLAASCMQTGAFEASYPVMAGIRWQKTYIAMLASPLTVYDVALGQLLWITARILFTAVVFTAVMVAFGAASSVWVVLAVPAAVLTGMATAAPVAAYTASIASEYSLANLMRFGIMPLFLFSGTFFPIEQLPDWIEPLAWVVPLWHGVELCRSLTLGDAELGRSLVHVAYLSACIVAGTAWALVGFRRKLVV